MQPQKKYTGKQIILIGLLCAITGSVIALIITLAIEQQVRQKNQLILPVKTEIVANKPMRTPVPPPTQRATITPEPSQTPLAHGIQTPACDSADIIAKKNLHAYYLQSIERHYAASEFYYQDILNNAKQAGDTTTLQSTQKTLDALALQKIAEINAENARYANTIPEACR